MRLSSIGASDIIIGIRYDLDISIKVYSFLPQTPQTSYLCLNRNSGTDVFKLMFESLKYSSANIRFLLLKILQHLTCFMIFGKITRVYFFSDRKYHLLAGVPAVWFLSFGN
jgi:hypothetical protein